MTLLPRGVKVHLAFGFIGMRKGIDGLAMLVQGVLRQDPFSDHLFLFRGRKAPEAARQMLGPGDLSSLTVDISSSIRCSTSSSF
jgi:IS66 Orf2 like protein